MNKAKLKAYAPQARKDFIAAVTARAHRIGLAYVKGALGRLHEGELSAIVLAQELSVDFVILDDLLARQKAQHLALNVMGTLGLLLLMAKRQLLTHQQLLAPVKNCSGILMVLRSFMFKIGFIFL